MGLSCILNQSVDVADLQVLQFYIEAGKKTNDQYASDE